MRLLLVSGRVQPHLYLVFGAHQPCMISSPSRCCTASRCQDFADRIATLPALTAKHKVIADAQHENAVDCILKKVDTLWGVEGGNRPEKVEHSSKKPLSNPQESHPNNRIKDLTFFFCWGNFSGNIREVLKVLLPGYYLFLWWKEMSFF